MFLGLALVVLLQTEELTGHYPDGSVRVVRQVHRDAAGEQVNQGDYRSDYRSDQEEWVGGYSDGLRTGDWTLDWENGEKKERGKYIRGEHSGIWREYDDRGERVCWGKRPFIASGPLIDGFRHGPWEYALARGGKLILEFQYGKHSGTRRFVHANGTWRYARLLGRR